MLLSISTTTLLHRSLLFLRARSQNAAACGAACDSYTSDIGITYQLYSQNVEVPGGLFARPTDTIMSMCGGAGTDIQTCYMCSQNTQDGLHGDAQVLLNAWWETCVAYNDAPGRNVNAAYACWQSVPSGSSSCSAAQSKKNDAGGRRGEGLAGSLAQVNILTGFVSLLWTIL